MTEEVNQTAAMVAEDSLESIVNDAIEVCEEAVEAAEIKEDVDTRANTKVIDVFLVTKLAELVALLRKYIGRVINAENASKLYNSGKKSGAEWLLHSPIGPVRSLKRLYISKEEDTNSNYIRFFVYASVMFFSLFCSWSQTFVSLTVLFASLALSGHNRVEKVVFAGRDVSLSVQVGLLLALSVPMFYKFGFAVPVSCAMLASFALTSVSYSVNELFHKASKWSALLSQLLNEDERIADDLDSLFQCGGWALGLVVSLHLFQFDDYQPINRLRWLEQLVKCSIGL